MFRGQRGEPLPTRPTQLKNRELEPSLRLFKTPEQVLLNADTALILPPVVS